MKKALDRHFIDGAIHTVARVGIENTRTKQIAEYAGFSEATLFRCFDTKEDLLNATFLEVDRKLFEMMTKNTSKVCQDSEEFEKKVRDDWHALYRHLIDNGDETLFIIRYRYSSLYTEKVRLERKSYTEDFDVASNEYQKHFGVPPIVSTAYIINVMFSMTVNFAEKVISGCLEDTVETEENFWSMIWSASRR